MNNLFYSNIVKTPTIEYSLSQLCTFNRGSPLSSKDSTPGPYPVISGGKKPAFYHETYNRKPGTIIIAGSGAYAGYVSYWDTPTFCADSFSVDVIDETILNTKYLYHFLLSIQDQIYSKKTGGGIPHVHGKDLKPIIIRIPSIEVQKEIVRILDSFTALTTELTAELNARKKQYEFYRDKLLSFSELTPEEIARQRVRWMSFGELATIVRGASPRPIQSYITKNEDGINWIKIGDVSTGEKYITSCEEKITQAGALKSRFVHPGDFILSNSMSFGRPYILSIEGCIHDGWLSISGYEQFVSADYLYHLLNSSYIQHEMSQKASSGTVKNLNADIVKSLKLPIPSREYQDRITKILDYFDKLCSNNSQGLRSEISARQKQYEYYRDKLLSFDEVKI